MLAARAHYRGAAEALGMAVFVAAADVADAVAFGRSGQRRGRAALMASARERLRRMPVGWRGMAHCQQMLVARAADPRRVGRTRRVAAREPRRSSPPAATTGSPAAAGRLLGAAGAPVPRRGRGDRRYRRRCGPRHHQPRARRAQAGRRGLSEPGDRRAALPVTQDRRAAPGEPVRPDRRPRAGRTAPSSPELAGRGQTG